jgi:hypothetical protein
MIPSPYSPGSLPVYLAGRGHELQVVRDRVARVDALGRSGGPLLAFYGPRGFGKTSLLRAAQREAIANGYLTVWVTGRDDAPIAPDLAGALAEEVRDSSLLAQAGVLLASLDKIQVEVGVPGAKISAETAPRRSGDAIEASLKHAARLARQHDHHGLVVFVDEFQDALKSDRRSLLIALQHFDGAPKGHPVAIIAAGLPALPSAVTDAATFGERTDFHELRLLNDVATIEALKLPAEPLGVRWTQQALEQAIELAQGYPHEVQLLGEAAWHAARPDKGGSITIGHVREGQETAALRMEQLFRARVAKTTEEQRRFLTAMASLGDGAITRGSIAAAMRVTTEAVSRPRQELIDRGLIEPAGHGRLKFTVPGFAAFLRTTQSQDQS